MQGGFRLPFILLAMVNMIFGLWSGMLRIGWDLPMPVIAVHHGAIMIGGFFTTLISLEKAIPLKKTALYAVPLISALSLIMIANFQAGLFFLVLGSVGLMTIQCWYLFKYPEDRSALLMVIGATCLVIANILLFRKQFYPIAFPWWMGFLLFTIVGERLELSRFLPVSKNARVALYCSLGLFLAGLILPFHGSGKYLSGVALILIAAWLLRYDVIRIGLRNKELTRYSALALLAGNIALIVEGVLLIVLSDTMLAYDAIVHTFFIGFGVTMVFAHGPIILPAVLGIYRKPYSPILYLWLLALQLSLYLRVYSDSVANLELRKYTGLLMAASILLYFLTIVTLIIRGRKATTAD